MDMVLPDVWFVKCVTFVTFDIELMNKIEDTQSFKDRELSWEQLV